MSGFILGFVSAAAFTIVLILLVALLDRFMND